MQRPNIIHIFGNNSFLVDREKQGFVAIFKKKYGEENIEPCPIDDKNDWKEYKNKIATVGLFQEKRLFLFYSGKS